MNGEELSPSTKRLLASSYSIGYPVSLAGLLYLRVRYGYDWPLPADFGLGIFGAGIFLVAVGLLASNFLGGSRSLRRQHIYWALWQSALGIWLYEKFLADRGMVFLFAIASGLWPLSLRENPRGRN